MTTPNPDPMTAERWYTLGEVDSLLKRSKTDLLAYGKTASELLYSKDSPFSTWLTMHLNLAFEKGKQIGAGEAAAEITRLQSVASHAETESQTYADIATEQKAEIVRLKSDNDCHRNSMKLMREGSLALLDRAAEMERQITSLTQLLKDCPANYLEGLRPITKVENDKIHNWVAKRREAIGET